MRSLLDNANIIIRLVLGNLLMGVRGVCGGGKGYIIIWNMPPVWDTTSKGFMGRGDMC